MSNQPMTPEQIIKNLQAYNECRRGNGHYGKYGITPGEIGIAIECAIAYIKTHEALNKADEDDGK